MLAETNLPDDSFKIPMHISRSRQVTGSDELRLLFADVGQCSPRVMRGSETRHTISADSDCKSPIIRKAGGIADNKITVIKM